MITIECEVLVNRPPEEVFAFIEDVSRWPEWITPLQKVEILESTTGKTRFRRIDKFVGKAVESITEVQESISPTKLILKNVENSAPTELIFILTPQNSQTHVLHTVHMEPGSVVSMAAPLIVRGLRRFIQKDLNILKERLEQN